MKLQIKSQADVNSLHWIKSLRAGEEGTTMRVLDDLEPYLASKGVPFQMYEPTNAADLLDVLQYIERLTRAGARPMIHLDTHGDKKKGLVLAASGQCIAWETLGDYLRYINVAAGNNLCVISAACFGFHLRKLNSVLRPAMFYILIGGPDEIYFDFTERSLFGFYKDVFDNSEIVEAQEKHLSSQTKLLHCEKEFVIGVTRYFSENCMGSGARRRIERLISEAVKDGLPQTPEKLGEARRIAREIVRPSNATFLKYANHHLIGKEPGVTYADIIGFIRRGNRSEFA